MGMTATQTSRPQASGPAIPPAPKVLFLDHTATLGGAELYLRDLVRLWGPTGSALLFDDGPLRDELEQSGVGVEVIVAGRSVRRVARDGGMISGLRAAPDVLSLARHVALRASGAEVLFANSQKALVVGAIASRMARRPLVWNLHDLLTPAHFSASRRRIAPWIANRTAHRVIVNSEATGNAFVAAGGDRARVRIAYNGIDASAFAPRPDPTLRRALGLADVPVVGVFSRLAPWKGQHTLLAALAEIPDAHALVVGGPLFGTADARYTSHLHALAAEMLPGRVHFLGFRSDIPALLQACDVVAHTSVAPEPFGRVIVEAMLSERPVVAAGGGGADEIIRHGQTGLLVLPDDPSALAQAIRFLLRQPGDARRIAAAGRSAAAERFTPARMLEAVRAAVEEAVWDQ